MDGSYSEFKDNYPACAYDCFRNKFDNSILENPRCKGTLYKLKIDDMAVGAAKEIDRREKEIEGLSDSINRSERAYNIARKSFYIAAAGFFLNLIVHFFNIICNAFPANIY